MLQVNKDGSLQLQAGILKISAKQSEVRVVDAPQAQRTETGAADGAARPEPDPSLRRPSELDIRGMMTDEGVAMVDRF